MRRLRGAVGIGVTWAIGWALVGLGIGVASLLFPGAMWDAFFRAFDAPLPALALPGFIGGVLYSTVLGIAGRRRRFDELSLRRVGAWGAAGGLLLGVLPGLMAAVGLAHPADGLNVWLSTAIISLPTTLLGAGSAMGSLLVARRAPQRELEAGAEAAALSGEPQSNMAQLGDA